VDISPTMIAKACQRIQAYVPVENSSGVSFLTGDVFEVIPSLQGQSFDLVFCLGLIAHTGRLDLIFSKIKSVLAPRGQILLQSTLLDHIGTRIVRFLSAKRYAKKHGYNINYFTHNDILRACERNGLRIVARRRFGMGVPFGDRIWKWVNFQFEKLFSPLASRVGSEALYLLECDSSA
jgi:SAM-dependent methyltransferase